MSNKTYKYSTVNGTDESNDANKEEETGDVVVSIQSQGDETEALVGSSSDRQIEFEATLDDEEEEEDLQPISELTVQKDLDRNSVKRSPSTAMSLNGGNDGVFANMSAKPDLSSKIEGSTSRNDEIELPTYDDVQNDGAAPTYMESVVIPSIVGEIHGDLVDGLPVGSVVSFFVTLFVSFTFQVVGFFMAFFLSTSHAGRNGAKAGLGVTLIQYGLYIRTNHGHIRHGGMNDEWFFWVSIFCILLGWLTIIRSVGDYVKIRKIQHLANQGS